MGAITGRDDFFHLYHIEPLQTAFTPQILVMDFVMFQTLLDNLYND